MMATKISKMFYWNNDDPQGDKNRQAQNLIQTPEQRMAFLLEQILLESKKQTAILERLEKRNYGPR